MRISMSGLMIEKILNQAGKITLLRVTGGVRPHHGILRFFNKIQHKFILYLKLGSIQTTVKSMGPIRSLSILDLGFITTDWQDH